jgi:cyclic beta-1,2-glucan synthetase
VVIEPGGEADVIVLLGQDATLEDARALIARYDAPGKVDAALEGTRNWWDGRLGTIQVSTPVKSVNFLLNRWLPYQALACRFWARSGFYQSSGAFGFRDQLQDAMALVYFAPEWTRQHILIAAARQFPQGDVQHWWHPDTGAGVRTRCSDDLLWLPYTVAHYVLVTGDTSILDEQIPFLGGAELLPEEQERMFTPPISEESSPLWDHCVRALDRAGHLGEHGLPLFGSGDWNDGMNRVGSQGRGESVWLAFFLCEALRSFAGVMQIHPRGPDKTTAWHQRIRDLESAISRHCWDGDWYLRGFFDDGTPLGSHNAAEAKIDALPQSWAVISGVGDPLRARRGMESATEFLVDEKNRLVRLLTPPFDHSEPHPGYIMGYPPGIRENGGQYTHGSLWTAQAWARLGDGNEAVRLLMLMNPIEHSRDPGAAERYRVEPYVAPADVYSAAARPGQGGWTWYTGSAAWMYRVWIEDVLGFRLQGTLLRITPTIPADWNEFQITYRYRSATYVIDVQRLRGNQPAAEYDGAVLLEPAFELVDDGRTHTLVVRVKTAVVAPAPPPALKPSSLQTV